MLQGITENQQCCQSGLSVCWTTCVHNLCLSVYPVYSCISSSISQTYISTYIPYIWNVDEDVQQICLLGTGISFKQNDKFTMFGLGEHVHRNSFDWSVRLATHLFGGLSHQAKSNTKETQQKIRTIQRTQTSRMYQSVLSDIDSTETYSMKLFMAPFGLQDTKTIFFRNGEFLNALTTCGSEIWVGYH